MRTKIEKFSNRLIEKNPSLKFTLPLVVILLFTWITISNIQEKIQSDTEELLSVSGKSILEYEIYETKEEKIYQKLLYKLRNKDYEISSIIKTKKLNNEIIDERLAYLNSKLKPFQDKYEIHKKDYDSIYPEYKALKALKYNYNNLYNQKLKMGKSTKWFKDEFRKRNSCCFEWKAKVVEVMIKDNLSYYSASKMLTKYNLVEKQNSRVGTAKSMFFNGQDAIQRINDELKYHNDVMNRMKSNMKRYKESIELYNKIRILL